MFCVFTMPATFSNAEYADMVFVYGFSEGNGVAAVAEYRRRFPNRRVPSREVFSRAYRTLRETGTLPSVRVAYERPIEQDVAEQENIIEMVQRSPQVSTRTISMRLRVPQTKVWRTLQDEGFYPDHADSSKARPGKKSEKLDENGATSKKRVNDTNDEPAPKRMKVDSKGSKSTDKSESSTAKKANEPKQMQNKTDTNLEEIDFECTKSNEEGEKYNLKISTWNVSGIRAVVKKNGIDYLTKEDADIIALQETKCDKDKMPNEVKLPGYHHYFLDSKKPGYCGVALFSKEKPISVKYGLNSTFDSEGRMITAEFSEFFMINVYVPNAGQKLVTLPKRLEWNKAFKQYVEELDQKKPVIICGDMNVAHQEIDLKNPKTNTKNAGFTKEERDDMTDFLSAGFVDSFRLLYPDTEGAYTFWSYFANSRGKDIGWRLDYFLISERIKNKVCDNVIRKQVYGSDHCPVILYINL